MKDLRVYDSLADAVGWTPLVRLRRTVPDAEAFAKLEYFNPMGSIKDRIAKHLINKALEDGSLARNGLIVEASSGNTALGLAMMAISEGLRSRMVIRKGTAAEKLASLQALGVELELVDPDLPPQDPRSYNRRAGELAIELGAFFPDQHHNRENNRAHYLSTGPEIWQQMEGRIDVLVAGIGTGGTISGVSRYLKEQDPSIHVVAIDAPGSVFTEHFESGRTEPMAQGGGSLLEGLGDEEVISCPEFECIDQMIRVTDRAAFRATRELAAQEAMLVGGSSGAALWGVRQVVDDIDAKDARIVTIFPDSGSRYLGTIFNDSWLLEHGLLD